MRQLVPKQRLSSSVNGNLIRPGFIQVRSDLDLLVQGQLEADISQNRKACAMLTCCWLFCVCLRPWLSGKLLLGLLSLLFFAQAALADEINPPEGTFIRVTVRGGATPFRGVIYDVTVRGKAVVVSIAKEGICAASPLHDVTVLEGEEAQRVTARLKDAFAKEPIPGATRGALEPEMARSASPRYEFWSSWGRHMERFWVDQATLLSSPELLAIFFTLKAIVASYTEPLPMRDLYHSPAEMGYLVVTANEEATAILDGWERFKIPIDGIDVAEGEHRLRVESASGKVREFIVRIVSGSTSRYHVVFDEDGP